MMRIREPTHLVPRNQYSPSSSRHQRAIMTKKLKINHERMQHAPAIVIDGAPVLSSRFITQLRKWLSHVLRQRVPFSTICPPSRSEERREGKEVFSTCKSRWSPKL